MYYDDAHHFDGGSEEFPDGARILRSWREVGFNRAPGLVFEPGERNSCSRAQCVQLAGSHLRQVEAGS